MKVSKQPSDYFPSALKKALKVSDYADAGAKLRGIAGELVFVLEGVELPGGLKIVGRHVDAAGKVIDFALHDASGARALLEVKAWSAKCWARELAVGGKKKLLTRMVEQLRAAQSTEQRVYLAVSDAIGELKPQLEIILSRRGLSDVTVLTFPEGRLGEVSRTLRKGLGMAGGAALVATDQIAEEDIDD